MLSEDITVDVFCAGLANLWKSRKLIYDQECVTPTNQNNITEKKITLKHLKSTIFWDV
jgi:hypothetical protein